MFTAASFVLIFVTIGDLNVVEVGNHILCHKIINKTIYVNAITINIVILIHFVYSRIMILIK